jgi:hypothetical protein
MGRPNQGRLSPRPKWEVTIVTQELATPLLVLDSENEQFWSGQPQELYDLLPKEKEIMRFTRAPGANPLPTLGPTAHEHAHARLAARHLPAQYR